FVHPISINRAREPRKSAVLSRGRVCEDRRRLRTMAEPENGRLGGGGGEAADGCCGGAQGEWGKLNWGNGEDDFAADYYLYGGGVPRMWEGELVNDCLDDRRIALQSTCCPCYSFGKNVKRAGLGSCFLQKMHLSVLGHFFCALSWSISGISPYADEEKGGDSSIDDCIYHLICPRCTLC
ncbi:PLAC8 family protein, partial [Striga asiatica]